MDNIKERKKLWLFIVPILILSMILSNAQISHAKWADEGTMIKTFAKTLSSIGADGVRSIYLSSSPNGVVQKHTGVNTANAVVASDGGGGSGFYCWYCKADKDVDVEVFYSKCLKIGTQYYDVLLKVDHVYGPDGKNVGFVIPKAKPGLGVGWADIDNIDRSQKQSVSAHVYIYYAGTKTQAKIPGLITGTTDTDDGEAWMYYGLSNKEGHIYIPDSSTSNFIKANDAANNSGDHYTCLIGTKTSENPKDGSTPLKTGANFNAYVTGTGIANGHMHVRYGTFTEHQWSGIILFDVPNIKYTVQYKAETGGSVTGKTSETVKQLETPTGSSQSPDQDHEFVGWKTNQAVETSTGKDYASGSIIPMSDIKDVIVNKNMSFTATYKIITYNVYYKVNALEPRYGTGDTDCGTVNPTSQVVNSGSKPAGATQTPKAHWAFQYWTADQTYGGLTSGQHVTMDQIKNVVVRTDGLSFTAHYLPQYEVTYNSKAIVPDENGNTNCGSNNPTSEWVTSHSKPTGSSPNPNAGWSFSYWKSDQTFGGLNGNGNVTMDQIKNVEVTKPLSYTAYYRPEFGVTYAVHALVPGNNGNTDCGTVNPTSEKVLYGENPKGATQTPKNRWHFEYWTSNLSGKDYYNKSSMISENEIKNVQVQGPVTFTANYSPIWEVKYVSDEGGEITGNKNEDVINDRNPVGSSIKTKSGYKIKGGTSTCWTADKEVTLKDGSKIPAGTMMDMNQIKNVVVQSDITFTANHDKLPEYKVTKIVNHSKEPLNGELQYNVTIEQIHANAIGGTVNIEDSFENKGLFNNDQKYTIKSCSNGTFQFVEQGAYGFKGKFVTNPGAAKVEITFACKPEKETLINGHALNNVKISGNPDDVVITPPNDKDDTDTEITYEISTSKEGNGTIDKSITDIPFKSNKTVNYNPDEGHHVTEITVDDKVIYQHGSAIDNESKDNPYPTSYPFNEIDDNHKINVKFSPNEYMVYTEVVNGDITDDTKVLWNCPHEVFYNPWDGYQLLNITVDGKTIDPDKFPNSYKFSNIKEDHHVKVEYEKIPNLAIKKTTDREKYNAGDIVHYTVTVSQTEKNAESRNVIIKDELPDYLHLDVDSLKANTGCNVLRADDKFFTIQVDSIKDSYTFHYDCTTDKPINADDLENLVSAESENTPNRPTDNAKINIGVPEPEIKKYSESTEVTYGDVVEYTIELNQNNKNAEFRNAVMEDVVPEGLEFIGDSITLSGDEATWKFDGEKLTVNVPVLTKQTIVKYSCKVTGKEGSRTNIATLIGDDLEFPLQDDHMILIKDPTLTIQKDASREWVAKNDKVHYAIKATVSDGNLVNGVIEDKIPEGIDVDDTTITCSVEGLKTTYSHENHVLRLEIPTLEANNDLILEYDATVSADEGSTLTNVATFNSENNAKNNGEPVQDDATVKIPKVSLNKSVDKTEISDGETVKWTIVATQEEPDFVLENAVIEDKIPEGMSMIEDSLTVEGDGATATYHDGMVVIKTDALKSSIVVSFETKLEKGIGNITNVATLNAEDLEKPLEASATTKAKEPVLSIDKKADVKKVKKGDKVIWTLKCNVKEADAVNVIITDKLPKGLEFVNGSVEIPDTIDGVWGYDAQTRVFSVQIPRMEKNNDFTISFVTEITMNKNDSIKNVAKMDADNNPGDPMEDDASVKVNKVKEYKKSPDKKASTPSATAKTEGTPAVGTGDNTGFAGWLALLGIAMAGACVGLIYSRRKNKAEDIQNK